MTFYDANVCEMNVREATPRALDRDRRVGTNALGAALFQMRFSKNGDLR